MKGWLLKTDKLLHIIAGILATQCSFIVSSIFFGLWWSILIAFVAGAIIAASKELIYDKALAQGVCEKKDFFATMLGVFVETLLLIITIII